MSIKNWIKQRYTSQYEEDEVQLTSEQKKRYRWQYISIIIPEFLGATVLIGGIVALINTLFDNPIGRTQQKLLVISMIAVLGYLLMQIILEHANQVRLIEERIYRRKIKNVKQEKENED